MQQANQSEEARRFWEKIVKGETPGACWVWTGAISSDGSVRIPEAPGSLPRLIRKPLECSRARTRLPHLYMGGAEVIPAVAAE